MSLREIGPQETLFFLMAVSYPGAVSMLWTGTEQFVTSFKTVCERGEGVPPMRWAAVKQRTRSALPLGELSPQATERALSVLAALGHLSQRERQGV